MTTEAEHEELPEPAGARRGTGFGLGLFVGALVGAAVALLFAPGPGRDTRRRLRRGLEDARERLGEGVEELDSRVRREIERRRR